MYRFIGFIREFGRLLYKFDSWLSILGKIPVILAAGGWLMVSLLSSPVDIIIWFPSSPIILWNYTIGGWIIILTILITLLIFCGIAGARSTSQAISVAYELEPDEENNMMRLLIENKGIKTIKPTASIQRIERNDGKSIKSLPLTLAWMHDQDVASHGDVLKADVVCVGGNNYSFGYNHHNLRKSYLTIPKKSATDEVISIDFVIQVTIPDTNISVKREFRLEPNSNYLLGYKIIGLYKRKWWRIFSY